MALNLISAGDLDTGKIKRYWCDTKEDFAELPIVAANSTVFIRTTGETYKINAAGEWKLDSSIGGGDPDSGDYILTEQDKEDIANEVAAMTPIKPIYDAELGVLFCNGVGIIITDNGSENVISYDLDSNTTETITIPYNSNVYGGGNGLDKRVAYPASSIIMYGGQIKTLAGGGLGGGSIGVSSIVINDGKIRFLGGGGMNNKTTDDSTGNTVGFASIVFNGGEVSTLYGGGPSGLSQVGHVNIEMNGGTVKWLTASGSNGDTGSTTMNINGGSIMVVQSVNRGTIGFATINVNGGTITNLYGGGETEDSSVDGRSYKTILHVLNGSVEKIAAGTANGVEDASYISGTYAAGIIGNEEEAKNLHLVEVVTPESLARWSNIPEI